MGRRVKRWHGRPVGNPGNAGSSPASPTICGGALRGAVGIGRLNWEVRLVLGGLPGALVPGFFQNKKGMRIKLSKKGVFALVVGLAVGFLVSLASCGKVERRKCRIWVVPESASLLTHEIRVDSFEMISAREADVWVDGRKARIFAKEIVPGF